MTYSPTNIIGRTQATQALFVPLVDIKRKAFEQHRNPALTLSAILLVLNREVLRSEVYVKAPVIAQSRTQLASICLNTSRHPSWY